MLLLIDRKLDLSQNKDFELACAAAKEVVGADNEKILLTLQKAFCKRQFNRENETQEDAIRVLLSMDSPAYATELGNDFKHDLLFNTDLALQKLINLYKGFNND